MARRHGHGHVHVPQADAGERQVEVSAVARRALTVLLGAMAAATVFGLVYLWPSGDSVQSDSTQFAAPGVTFPVAVVNDVLPLCPEETPSQPGAGGGPGQPSQPGSDPSAGAAPTCGVIVVTLDPSDVPAGDPAEVAVQVPPAIARSGLQAGDRVMLLGVPAQSGTPDSFSFLQVQRGPPLVLFLVMFVVAVAVVARLRGVLALAGLVVGGIVVVTFMLPALLEGRSGLAVALVGSSAIMFVVLYLAHGLSVRTSTALAGTLLGVGITAALGLLGSGLARLSGVGDDEGAILISLVGTLDPRDLLTCAIIVAGLGVLNDVTITQSSAVWELRAAAPAMGRRDLFVSGMRIGRDHIASTIYTIVFAYAGAALPVLLLLYVYDRPVLDMLQTESLSQEIVSTLASAIGLVLAVPATTAVAALTVGVAEVAPARRKAVR